MQDIQSRPEWFFSRSDERQGNQRRLGKGLTARIFAGENSMLSVVRVDPSSQGKVHSHPEEQWGVVLEGECVRIQGGREIDAKVGDFWHTPPNAPHGIRTAERGALILDVFSPPRKEFRVPGVSPPTAERLSPAPGKTVAEPLDGLLLERASAIGTAVFHDVAASAAGALPSTIRPLFKHARLCGPALTVSCPPGDNLWLHRAVYAATPGAIIVAATGSYHEAGYWGDILGQAALTRELGGLVIDGCVRDSDEIERLGFPVFATGRCIHGATKNAELTGFLGRSIQVGACTIRTGDLIVGDSDGVVAVRRDALGAVLSSATRHAAQEAEWGRRLQQGERTLDLLGLE